MGENQGVAVQVIDRDHLVARPRKEVFEDRVPVRRGPVSDRHRRTVLALDGAPPFPVQGRGLLEGRGTGPPLAGGGVARQQEPAEPNRGKGGPKRRLSVHKRVSSSKVLLHLGPGSFGWSQGSADGHAKPGAPGPRPVPGQAKPGEKAARPPRLSQRRRPRLVVLSILM